MYLVTPLAGVWIEIVRGDLSKCISKSLPLRECGLKYTPDCLALQKPRVTPLAGVWIEIVSIIYGYKGVEGHSPCGSVD